MKKRPILFSGPTVRAILEGRKTQTRRVVKSLCGHFDFYDFRDGDAYPYYFRRKDGVWDSFKTIDELAAKYCPYGKAGDRLWVREAWFQGKEKIWYKADIQDLSKCGISGWKTPLFMPRSASRILLEAKSVRLERLQDISEDDAIAEGVQRFNEEDLFFNYQAPQDAWAYENWLSSPIDSFRTLWDSINADRGYSWESNPWVWCVEFKQVNQGVNAA